VQVVHEPSDAIEVRAAGGVVWRSAAGEPEILLVHRPRYGDWTLPKGKNEPDEPDEVCAVREVLEETGMRVELGPLLCRVQYTDARGRAKEVAYFDLCATVGSFEPNDEVDEVRWAVPAVAKAALTYAHDVAVIDAFLEARRLSG
jgi:8-oxo-dGTP diphosphatase